MLCDCEYCARALRRQLAAALRDCGRCALADQALLPVRTARSADRRPSTSADLPIAPTLQPDAIDGAELPQCGRRVERADRASVAAPRRSWRRSASPAATTSLMCARHRRTVVVVRTDLAAARAKSTRTVSVALVRRVRSPSTVRERAIRVARSAMPTDARCRRLHSQARSTRRSRREDCQSTSTHEAARSSRAASRATASRSALDATGARTPSALRQRSPRSRRPAVELTPTCADRGACIGDRRGASVRDAGQRDPRRRDLVRRASADVPTGVGAAPTRVARACAHAGDVGSRIQRPSRDSHCEHSIGSTRSRGERSPTRQSDADRRIAARYREPTSDLAARFSRLRQLAAIA